MIGNGADGEVTWIRATMGDEFCRACYLEEKHLAEGSEAAVAAIAALVNRPTERRGDGVPGGAGGL